MLRLLLLERGETCPSVRNLPQAARSGKLSMPQDEGILPRQLVVVASHGIDHEPERQVEPSSRLIRPPDFQSGGPRARINRVAKHLPEEPPGDSAAALALVHGEAVDMEFIEDEPAGAVGHDRAVRV